MVHAKNYRTLSTVVKVMQKKNRGLFFSVPDTVYTGWAKKVSLLIFAITLSTASQFA